MVAARDPMNCMQERVNILLKEVFWVIWRDDALVKTKERRPESPIWVVPDPRSLAVRFSGPLLVRGGALDLLAHECVRLQHP
jgi:hypothetical protein